MRNMPTPYQHLSDGGGRSTLSHLSPYSSSIHLTFLIDSINMGT
jgi:hypothetical protein